jgi:hypothetical protein
MVVLPELTDTEEKLVDALVGGVVEVVWALCKYNHVMSAKLLRFAARELDGHADVDELMADKIGKS